MHKVLDSVKYVVETSNNIYINHDAIKYFCRNNYIDININWLLPSPSIISSLPFEKKLSFVTILNSISFCFWHLPKWEVKYRGKIFDGSWGMIAALSKAYEKDIKNLDFDFLKDLSLEQFNAIIEDDSKMILRNERVNIINKVASKIVNNYNSNVFDLLLASKMDALVLQNILLSEFESFRDSSKYNNETIYFNKRVQLLTADLNFLLKQNGMKGLKNIELITACADYKIPYILREFGIITYYAELSDIVNNRIQIEKGTKHEVEIRAHAIWAVELMKKEYHKLGQKIESHQINDFLWMISQIKNPIYKPYHLTVTTSY